MPKTVNRYLILFGEKNANGRVYTHDSIKKYEFKPFYLVHNGAPANSDVPLGQCCATCKLAADDVGLYMREFKFMRDINKPGKPLIENAKRLLDMIRRLPGCVYPVTAGTGEVDADGTVKNFRVTSVFFTPHPSFKQLKK